MNRKIKDGKSSDMRVSPEKDLNVEHESDGLLKDLLEKTRQVGRALQSRRDGDSLDYIKLAKLLSEFSTANVYILGRDGKILGFAWVPEYNSQTLSDFMKDGYMPEEFVEKMNRCRESEVCDDDAYMFDDADKKNPEKHLMYVPIYGAAAERLGTVVLVRFHNPFVTKDILLAEYSG